jgi:hypothetical protein
MRFLSLAVVAALCVLSSTGCATVITGAGPNQTIKISSNPRGAKVYVDGEYKGVTPVGVRMTRSDNHTIVVEKDGYATARREVEPGWNPWQLGNIVLGGLVGTAIDFIDGSFIWLGGPVRMQLVRASPPEISGEPGIASSRARGPERARSKRAAPAPAPVVADADARSRSAPLTAYSNGDYQPTHLPPRRRADARP